jgi:5-methylcytosine-specific restriction endonuclease McrA
MTCHYCGTKLVCGQWPAWDSATVDHFISVGNGGSDDMSNLVACCRNCNCRKGERPAERWMKNMPTPAMIEDMLAGLDPDRNYACA